jgi:hypothetical protein
MINLYIPLFLWIILQAMYNNILMFSLITTCVACAIPSVNTLKAQLSFPSKPNFAICFNS